MNPQIQASNQRALTTPPESIVTEMDMLTQCGFTTEESAALLWLRHWYQSGGSDRMELVRHWEFLKRLVLANRLEV
ncbi:MAG TPA: hypothetical protein VF026_21755 [Ktedonobacteraceae bacterium]